jgi:hypothetical protein
MKDEERQARLVQEYEEGRTAYTLKEKALKDKCFLEMRADLMLKFQQTTFREDDVRTEIWRKMQAIEWLDGKLTDLINNGTIAEDDLKGFQKVKQFFKR